MQQSKTFTEQRTRARMLGVRMGSKGFAVTDNPYEGVHPAFALEWQVGHATATIAEGMHMVLKEPRRNLRSLGVVRA